MLVADRHVRVFGGRASAIRPDADQHDDADQRDQGETSDFDGRKELDLLLGRRQQDRAAEADALRPGEGDQLRQYQRDATHRVPQSVQQRHASVCSDDARGESQMPVARRAKQDAADYACPQAMANRREDAAQELGKDQAAQR